MRNIMRSRHEFVAPKCFFIMCKILPLTIIVVLGCVCTALTFPVEVEVDLVLSDNPLEDVEDDGTVRNQRSANFSLINSRARKIQLIFHNKYYLHIYPDGSVNGTEAQNDYTILQRISVNLKQIKLQGVATCNFLCMDGCGFLYASREFTDECVFNEMIELNHLNTYSSSKYSNDKRTLYVALNKKGLPRKVQVQPKASLGKLGVHTNVLTSAVAPSRVEQLVIKLMSEKFLSNPNEVETVSHHPLRHHGNHQLCPSVLVNDLSDKYKNKCKKKKKRKEDEEDFQPIKKKPNLGRKKCEEGEEIEECQRRLQMIRRKRKSRNGEEDGGEKKRLNKKNKKIVKQHDGERTGSDDILWRDVFGHVETDRVLPINSSATFNSDLLSFSSTKTD